MTFVARQSTRGAKIGSATCARTRQGNAPACQPARSGMTKRTIQMASEFDPLEGAVTAVATGGQL